MPKSNSKSFGDTIRQARKENGISLRKFAKKINKSATYISKIERGEFKPPAEATITTIAKALGLDPDELMELAGRVPSDLTEIIQTRQRKIATFLRTIDGLSPEKLARLQKQAERMKGTNEK